MLATGVSICCELWSTLFGGAYSYVIPGLNATAVSQKYSGNSQIHPLPFRYSIHSPALTFIENVWIKYR
jgi:hypothetical protein